MLRACTVVHSRSFHLAQSTSNSNSTSSWFLPEPAHSSAAANYPPVALDDGSGSGHGGNSRRHRWRGGGDSNPWGSSSTALHWWQQLLAVLTAALLPIVLTAPAQAAAATSKRSGFVSHQDENMVSSWQLDAFVDRMWDLSGPILNNMGFSGILGACTAAALKVGIEFVYSSWQATHSKRSVCSHVGCNRCILRCTASSLSAIHYLSCSCRCHCWQLLLLVYCCCSLSGVPWQHPWALAWCWSRCCPTTTSSQSTGLLYISRRAKCWTPQETGKQQQQG